MARPVTLLLVFFISFNLLAGVFMSTGVAAMIGIDANVGGDAAVDQRTGTDEINTGTGQGETLFGLRNLLGGQVADLFGAIFPGLEMLRRAGVPGELIGGFLGPLTSIMLTVGVISFMRGYSL